MAIKKKRWHCLPGQPLTDLDKQVMYWESKGKLVHTRTNSLCHSVETTRIHYSALADAFYLYAVLQGPRCHSCLPQL